MNSFVIYEALTVGFKEGCKIGIVWVVFYSYLVLYDRKTLFKPFIAGVVSSLIISFSVFFLPTGPFSREYIVNFISMSFAVFLVSSAGSLLNASGINLFSPFKDLIKGESFIEAAVFFTAIFFFLPDYAGTVLYLRELSSLHEESLMSYVSAVAGLLTAGAIFFAVARYFKARMIGSFFDLPQILLFLAVVKLFGAGTKGLTEISLIPSVQRGLMKFSHDVIHQVLVLLMVPDHPFLKVTVWNFIGIFFGPNIASLESLLILLFFPLMFIYYSLLKPLPEPEAQTGAEKRKIKHLILSERRKKALPVIAFVLIIIISWFSQRGESVSRLYIPKPKPVVEDKGMVIIPVNDPTMDLRDGALHTFSLNYQGQEIRILIIKKSGDTLAVCLDACEICPPDGYGQREDHVVCIYCNTPIPIKTLGEPGGCNPIPLSASVDDKFVRIDLSEIMKKWEYVKTGKSKEAIK